jgi:hypothetical protein
MPSLTAVEDGREPILMPIVNRLAALATVLAGGLVVGLAASIVLSSGSLGAARTATPRCTNAGVSVSQNLSSGTVISVTVAGLPAACAGATLQVTVNNGTANSSGSATVAAGGGSVTATLATAPALKLADEIDLVLTGP